MVIDFIIGACCPHGAARFPGRVFAEIANADGRPLPGSTFRQDTPVRPLDFEVPVTLPLCAHEAAHATVATLLGLHVREVVVGVVNEARIDWAKSPQISNLHLGIMLLAGWHGQNRISRFTYRMRDEEIAAYVTAARSGHVGQCDECRVAAIAATVTDDEAIIFWRELERQTLELLDRLDVWKAIRQIADRLMTERKISGDEVRRLARAAVDVESFKTPAWGEGDENV